MAWLWSTWLLFACIDGILYAIVPYSFRTRWPWWRLLPGVGIHIFTRWIQSRED